MYQPIVNMVSSIELCFASTMLFFCTAFCARITLIQTSMYGDTDTHRRYITGVLQEYRGLITGVQRFDYRRTEV